MNEQINSVDSNCPMVVLPLPLTPIITIIDDLPREVIEVALGLKDIVVFTVLITRPVEMLLKPGQSVRRSNC